MIAFQLVVQHRAAGVLTSTNFNLDALGSNKPGKTVCLAMRYVRPLITLSLSFFLACASNAQTILVNPYLQDANPTSMKILWETDGGSAGEVAWGTDATNLNLSIAASTTPTAGGFFRTV
ncbi:MAG: hypothetical protein ACJAZ9_000821 [Neolewinella sp.]|jgi:hypothetical protein